MAIKAIQIKNFWQQGNLHWELFPDVNVLVGNNGMGKTTILNMIEASLERWTKNVDLEKFGFVESFTVQLDDGNFVIVDSDGRREVGLALANDLNIKKIATFDAGNEINLLLKDNKELFVTYQRNLLSEVQSVYESGLDDADKSDKVKEIFKRKNIFIAFINSLFSATGKEFDEKEFAFRKEGQKSLISYDELSSGEKQIFLILLVVLLQEGKPTILLLDEPEISLNIEWQRELIRMIRELNDMCQIIAVTHSPTLYFRGWADRKKNIEDIFEENHDRKDLLELNKYPTSRILSLFEEKINEARKLPNEEVKARLWYLNSWLKNEISLVWEDCDGLLGLLKEKEIQPDIYTYTTLISNSRGSEVAKKVFDLISHDEKVKPTIGLVTLNAMLKKEEVFSKAIEWLHRFSDYGISPEISTFSTLLAKANSQSEAETVDDMRSAFYVEETPQYTKKLKKKL